MMIDGYAFTITLHVVLNKVLVSDFLDQIGLRVKRGEVTFLQLDRQTDSYEDASDILRVNMIEQNNEINLAHVQEPHYRESIRDIIRGYKPERWERWDNRKKRFEKRQTRSTKTAKSGAV